MFEASVLLNGRVYGSTALVATGFGGSRGLPFVPSAVVVTLLTFCPPEAASDCTELLEPLHCNGFVPFGLAFDITEVLETDEDEL